MRLMGIQWSGGIFVGANFVIFSFKFSIDYKFWVFVGLSLVLFWPEGLLEILL